MGRWSRLHWCWGLVAAAGCATPGIDNGSITKQGLSEPLPQVTLQSNQVGGPANRGKDPDLAPDKAAKLCMATAEELEKNGHLEQAIAQYELAMQHHAKLPGAGKKLAACYARAGKYDQAIAQYQKDLAASPKDVDLLNDLGYTYFEKEDYVTAEKYLRQAIAIKPGYQRAHGNLGYVLGSQMKWKESLEAFRKAGTPATAQSNLAAMYYKAGLTDDARRSCSIALGLDPSLKTAKDLLAKLDEQPKDDSKSIKQAEAKLTKELSGSSIETASRTMDEPSGATDPKAVQLQRPVRVNRQNSPQEFKPAGR